MNLFGISSAIIFFTSIGFGFFVYTRDPKSKLNQSWLFFFFRRRILGARTVWSDFGRERKSGFEVAISFGRIRDICTGALLVLHFPSSQPKESLHQGIFVYRYSRSSRVQFLYLF